MTSGFDGGFDGGFDKDYWESHWRRANRPALDGLIASNPYLTQEVSGLVPGTALDAGCGEGAEAIWLADAGWRVTAVDISAEALARAAQRQSTAVGHESIRWVEADLSVWEPRTEFDLVATHYAHPAMPQLAFYARIADWVAPGGTLLIVGHLLTASHGEHGHDGHGHGEHGHGEHGHGEHGHGEHGHDGHGHSEHGHDEHGHDEHGHDEHGHDEHGHGEHGHQPPAEAAVTAATITAELDPAQWDVVTAAERSRTLDDGAGHGVELHDVVVRAVRRP